MKQKKYPELKWIYKVIISNDFLINAISGLVVNLFMVFSKIIEAGSIWHYFLIGSLIFSPFYIFHLISSTAKIRDLYIKQDDLETTDLKKLTIKQH